MDSDSSQTLAIIDVKNGRNLVIQGPPGTGKSQTITNLIAEAIASDRRVLFVAEKMAALDVVKRRLDDIHIGDACLELHSQKANKRAVLDELKRTLGLGKPKLSDPTEDRALLAANRTRLNDYCGAVNTQIGQSDVSVHDVVGRLAQLARSGPAEWPPVTIDGAASWTRAEFTRRLDQVDALRALVSTIGAPGGHVFWISGRRSLLPMDRSAVARALNEAADTADALRTALEALRTLLWLESTPDSTEQTTILVRSVLHAANAPDLVGVDHRHPAWFDRADSLSGAARAIGALTDLHNDYDRLLTPAAWEAAVEPYRQPIRTWGRRWWRFCSGTYRRARNGLRDLCREALPADGAAQLGIVEAILEAQRLQQTVGASRDLLLRLLPDRMVDGDATQRRLLGKTVSWLNDCMPTGHPAGSTPPFMRFSTARSTGQRSRITRIAVEPPLRRFPALSMPWLRISRLFPPDSRMYMPFLVVVSPPSRRGCNAPVASSTRSTTSSGSINRKPGSRTTVSKQ